MDNPQIGQNVILTEDKYNSLSKEDKKKIFGKGLIVRLIENEKILLVFKDRTGGMWVKKSDIDPVSF